MSFGEALGCRLLRDRRHGELPEMCQVADSLATVNASLDGTFVDSLYETDGTEMVKA